MEKILGIETSCDETGLAIFDGERGLLGHVLYSQIKLHAQYGGVVPELASRDHVRKTLPLLTQLLQNTDLSLQDLSAVAYTAGPGLIGSLLVGATIAKSIAFALKIPSIGVHHMEAHLLAPCLEENAPDFPFIALLVSGGHTQLVEVKKLGNYALLGESLDDAAGEAFDKVAKILGLAYPGGVAVAKLAEQGDAKRFRFPRPMTNRPGLDFSFSGLKTFALNTFNESDHSTQTHADIAFAFQEAVVDTLTIKCRRALKQTGLKKLVIAGGVSANLLLRQKLKNMAEQEGAMLYYPRLEFCTDNGAMVAYTGYRRLLLGHKENLSIRIFPRWPITEI